MRTPAEWFMTKVNLITPLWFTKTNITLTGWGDKVYFSHESNHSAGVLILIKFKGDIVDSREVRWVIVTKLENATFIIWNIYGHNLSSANKCLTSSLRVSCENIKSSFVLLLYKNKAFLLVRSLNSRVFCEITFNKLNYSLAFT